MMDNDRVGDCEIARMGHMLMNVTAHTGKMVVPSDEEVIQVYSAITGYDPSKTQPDGSNPTDNGANTEDVMNYWQNTGIAGHKIAGWVKVASSQEAIQQAIWLFGAAALDVAIYQSMMDQTNADEPWDNPSWRSDRLSRYSSNGIWQRRTHGSDMGWAAADRLADLPPDSARCLRCD